MAITNLYPNLPAHLVQFKDGGLTSIESPTEDKGGKSLLLLGTALDGPIMEPVQVDATTVDKVFGKEVDEYGISNGATLTKYAKQAFKNGFHDVRCMRVTGSNSSVKIVKSVVTNTYEEPVVKKIQLPSNTATDITVENKPIQVGSVNCTVDGEPYAPTVTWGLGLIQFGANIGRSYGDINLNYAYFDVQEKEFSGTLTKLFPEDEEDNTLVFSFTDNLYPNLESGEFLYITETDPATGQLVDDGINSTPASEGLISVSVNGVDKGDPWFFCQIEVSNNLLYMATFDPEETEVAAGDTVTFKAYVAKRIAVTENPELNGGYDNREFAVDADKPITEGSVTVAGNYVEGTDYTVSSTGITLLKAGKWPAGVDITFNYTTTIVESKEDSFTVNSRYGGAAYNGATIEFSRNENNTMRVKFTKPVDKIISSDDLPFYYDTPVAGQAGVKTVGQLREQLDNYQYNNFFDLVTDDDNLLIEDFPEGVYTMTGGENGVNVSMDDMFQALSGKRYTREDFENGECAELEIGFLKEQGAYQYLENYNVDFIIPVGVYADVVPETAAKLHTTFQDELATVCAVLTYRTKMTHGFIDVKPNTNTTLRGVQNYVEHLLSYDNIHYMSDQDGTIISDGDGEKLDIGWYTSLVVGPDPIMISDKLGRYYGSPAIAYAALCSSLKPESAPTNKAIPGAVGMRYAFSNKQMNELVGNKLVVFKQKNANVGIRNSVPYVVDGCTSGAPNSDYGRISTVKIVTDVVDNVREVCEPFIGEPNTIEQRNAMSALISKRLTYLMEGGEITSYEFQVDATIQEVISGECRITLVLTVPMELRKITTTVALRAAA